MLAKNCRIWTKMRGNVDSILRPSAKSRFPQNHIFRPLKGFNELLMRVTRCYNVDQPGQGWECSAETPLALEARKEARKLRKRPCLMTYSFTPVLRRLQSKAVSSDVSNPWPPHREVWLKVYWEDIWAIKRDLQCRIEQFIIPHFPGPRVLYTIL